MQQLGIMIKDFFSNNVVSLGSVAIYAGFVLIGFALAVPGRKFTDWAKEHIMGLLLGAALIYTASGITADIVASFGF